jgi:anion-transporting  ArsA/GET3 family ATPase
MFARKAASLGKRVLLIEINHESQHQNALQIPSKLHTMQQAKGALFHLNAVYEYNFRDYVVKYLGMEKVFNQVFGQNLVRSFLRTVPGLNEITFLGRLYYECEVNQDEPFDLVIFDGFASGHFLKLMTTPDGIERSGLVGPVLKETVNIRKFLSNKEKVGTVYVSNPEKLITTEVLEFVGLLEEKTPLKNSTVLLNGCLRSSLKDLAPLESGALAAYLSRRVEIQSEIIDQFKSEKSQTTTDFLRSSLIAPMRPDSESAQWQDYWEALGLGEEP